MKKLLTTLAVAVFFQSSYCQFILQEDFNFTGNLTDNGWTSYAIGTGSSSAVLLQTHTDNLFFDGYFSNNGHSASVLGVANGQDVYRAFGTQTKVYYSFLIKVTSNTSRNDFVTFLGKLNNAGTNILGNYFARTIIRTTGNGYWKIGITNRALDDVQYPQVYSTETYQINQTYAVILSFDYNDNRKVKVWVKSTAFPAMESLAGPPTIVYEGANETGVVPTSIDAVGLRQDVGSPNILIDGLRVFTDWSVAILPLKLLSFSGYLQDQSIHLHWNTVQEKNVKHFELESSADGHVFETISTIPAKNQEGMQTYSYTHFSSLGSASFFRLKMVDLDGSFHYSHVINIALSDNSEFKIGMLGGKQIRVFLPDMAQMSNVRVMDFSGNVRKNQNVPAHQREIQISLSELAPGPYIIELKSNQQKLVKKFQLY